MGWQVGWDNDRKRFIGYGVPSYCEHPGCETKIDRGLAHTCGDLTLHGNTGCGMFFCDIHRGLYNKRINGSIECVELCYRCGHYKKPYKQKPEHPDWIKHILTDDSWAEWRSENKEEVTRIKSGVYLE